MSIPPLAKTIPVKPPIVNKNKTKFKFFKTLEI